LTLAGRGQSSVNRHIVGRANSKAHIEARFEFYDSLAKELEIPGMAVKRNRAYDDERARNGGISLELDSYFKALPELKPEVLLEIGFARTAPNEPRDFTSWALERALQANVDVIDNRATAVKCFNPGSVHPGAARSDRDAVTLALRPGITGARAPGCTEHPITLALVFSSHVALPKAVEATSC